MVKTEIWTESEKRKCTLPGPNLGNRCILSSFVYVGMFYLFAVRTGGEAESQKSLAPAPSPAPQQNTRQNQHGSRSNKSRPRPSTNSHNASLAPLFPLDDGQGSSSGKKIGKSGRLSEILKTSPQFSPIFRHKERLR